MCHGGGPDSAGQPAPHSGRGLIRLRQRRLATIGGASIVLSGDCFAELLPDLLESLFWPQLRDEILHLRPDPAVVDGASLCAFQVVNQLIKHRLVVTLFDPGLEPLQLFRNWTVVVSRLGRYQSMVRQ